MAMLDATMMQQELTVAHLTQPPQQHGVRSLSRYSTPKATPISGTRSLDCSPNSLARALDRGAHPSSLQQLTTSNPGTSTIPHHPCACPHHHAALPSPSKELRHPWTVKRFLTNASSREVALIMVCLVVLGIVLHASLLCYVVLHMRADAAAETDPAPAAVVALVTETPQMTDSTVVLTPTGRRIRSRVPEVPLNIQTTPPVVFEQASVQSQPTPELTTAFAQPITPELTPLVAQPVASSIVKPGEAVSTPLAQAVLEVDVPVAPMDSPDILAEYRRFEGWLDSGSHPVLAPVNQPEPFSLVYSWVDGTDPSFVRSQRWFNRLRSGAVHERTITLTVAQPEDNNRFRQFDELRFSLRSVFKHAAQPKIDVSQIYVLVHDCLQTPGQLDMSGLPNATTLPLCRSKSAMAVDGTIPATEWNNVMTSAVGGDMQVPNWIDPDHPFMSDPSKPSGGTTKIALVPHSQLWAAQKNPILPTFNSFAIESRLVSLKRALPKLTRRFVYLNDDMMFGGELSTSHFWSEMYGLVFYTEDLLVNPGLTLGQMKASAAPDFERGQGEWAALDYTSAVLSQRFGRRPRPYLSHYAHVMDAEILTEMSLDPVLAPELERTSQNRFRGDAYELHLPFLFAHYTMERSREVLLRTYITGKLDENHDGLIDGREKDALVSVISRYFDSTQGCVAAQVKADQHHRAMIIKKQQQLARQADPRAVQQRLRAGAAGAHSIPESPTAAQDAIDEARIQAELAAACPPRQTLKAEKDQVQDHPGTTLLFSSLDGFAYSRTDAGGPAGHGPTLTASTPVEQRRCAFQLNRCLGEAWNGDRSSFAAVSSEQVLHTLARVEAGCGDCLLMMLVTLSGPTGLSEILPSAANAQTHACQAQPESLDQQQSPSVEYRRVDDPFLAPLDLAPPSVPVPPYDSSLHADLRPMCPSTIDYHWRASAIHAIRRYQYVHASGTGLFTTIGTLATETGLRKVEEQRQRAKPTFLCVNDDRAGRSGEAYKNFRRILQAWFPTSTPLEKPQSEISPAPQSEPEVRQPTYASQSPLYYDPVNSPSTSSLPPWQPPSVQRQSQEPRWQSQSLARQSLTRRNAQQQNSQRYAPYVPPYARQRVPS